MNTLKALSLFLLVAFISYGIKQHKIESDINNIKVGDSKEKVESILGGARELSIEGDTKTKVHNRCLNSKRLYYKGNTCLIFCLTSFEDYLDITYDKNEKICHIRRYGL